MRYRLGFALGFGFGYVLGSRAGRERYEALMRAFRNAREQPAVQEAAGVVAAQAGTFAQRAREILVGRGVQDHSDLPSPSPNGSHRG